MSRAQQRKGRVSGKRRRAREMAVQMLYQQEVGGATLPDVFRTFDVADYLTETEEDSAGSGSELPDRRAVESFEHAQSLVRGTVENGDRIDSLIREHAENWRLERMPAIDRNILRLAVYEMLHEASVPKVVIVDEAIELAKKFGAESSGRFVNGLLDGVLKSSKLADSPQAVSTPPPAKGQGHLPGGAGSKKSGRPKQPEGSRG